MFRVHGISSASFIALMGSLCYLKLGSQVVNGSNNAISTEHWPEAGRFKLLLIPAACGASYLHSQNSGCERYLSR